MPRYRITLKAEGVPLKQAKDIKTTTFEANTTDPETLHQAAADYVVDEKILDEWAFRKYWEIASVTFCSPRVESLKADIINITDDDVDKYQQLRTAPTSVLSMNFLGNDEDGWETGKLVLTDETLDTYNDWWQDFIANHNLTPQETPHAHEMMLRTTVEVSKSIPLKIPDNPSAHDELIRTSMRFESLLASFLHDTTV